MPVPSGRLRAPRLEESRWSRRDKETFFINFPSQPLALLQPSSFHAIAEISTV
jgi:hypothetical protein